MQDIQINILEKLAQYYKEEIKYYLDLKDKRKNTNSEIEGKVLTDDVNDQRARLSAIEETIKIAGMTEGQIKILRKQAKKDHEKNK
jgi:transcription elongation factor GreA-like protein